MFHISNMAHPTILILTFLKSLDLPKTPCEGIFHGPGPLGKCVTRTGVSWDHTEAFLLFNLSQKSLPCYKYPVFVFTHRRFYVQNLSMLPPALPSAIGYTIFFVQHCNIIHLFVALLNFKYLIF